MRERGEKKTDSIQGMIVTKAEPLNIFHFSATVLII